MSMSKRLNDSGYSEDCKDTRDSSRVHFFMKIAKGKADSEWTIHYVEKYEKLCNANVPSHPKTEFNNRLVGAKICGLDGIAFVNPFHLPCHFIEENSEVEWEECDKEIYVLNQPPRDTDMKGEPFLFFISNSKVDRKKGICITNVPFCNVQRFNYICVVAYPSQTFKQALEHDLRFKNELIDRFKLTKKIEGTTSGYNIKLNDQVQNHKRVVLQILCPLVRKKGPPVQNKSNDPMLESGNAPRNDASTEPVSESASENSENPREKLAKKLWEENALYVFTKNDDLTTEKLHAEREACLRARAWFTLVRPQDRRETRYEKGISRVAKIEFANQDVVARPVFFSREMCELYGSVGFLTCGSVQATCFLVGDNIVATCYHVVDDIENARKDSVPGDHSTVSVCFDYEKQDRDSGWQDKRMYRLLPLRNARNRLSKGLDYAFLYLEGKVEHIKALGENVSRAVPENGTLCIVGHPNCKHKVEEMCPILPLNDNRRSLQFKRRLEEQGRQNHQDRMVLQMYRAKSLMTYDVGSMVQGSSGAPVFNMRCEIVALHTLGFPLDETSSLEAGVTFDAIIADLERNGHSEFVRENFKNAEVDDMEED